MNGGPDLPEPYRNGTAAAHLEHGARVITLTLPVGPSSLHRNRYERAWLTLVERAPWSGEAWLRASRRLDASSWAQVPFTDAGRTAVAADVMPTVHRYGFDRWWTDLHRTRTDATREVPDGLAEARRIVEWWEQRETLAAAHSAGLLDLRPIDGRASTVLVVELDSRMGRTRVVAAAWLDGEQVGWMTERGTIVPPEWVLRPAA